MNTRPPRWSRAPLALATALLLGGCFSSGAPHPRGAALAVTEHDFGIHLSSNHIAAGVVTLAIHNSGPDQHELIVVPEARHGEPFRSDGFTVNEEALQSQEAGSINPQHPGGTENLTLNLRPGRYLLFCNMAGHYMAGMHVELEVSG